MIEIIIQKVEMPDINDRRFKKDPKDMNGRKWTVTDTVQKRIIYTGKFEEASLICHNLNKKFYKELGTVSNGS